MGANLTYVNFITANLGSANLTGANLDNTYLVLVSYDNKTVCPDGKFATSSTCLVQPS